ncbi:aldehyde dehydrogenase family 3 member B1 [Caerostris extrusa]|uniref:Aldehyde dehydrogenase family 3 member B1 n=1 Tax=Caerostris extrusa TaxID=172846 RepID=A0AAV4QT68_CAEEX|nr:aldehyde dehydrogenase family 3 member B1 [Caerostris extrusa]
MRSFESVPPAFTEGKLPCDIRNGFSFLFLRFLSALVYLFDQRMRQQDWELQSKKDTEFCGLKMTSYSEIVSTARNAFNRDLTKPLDFRIKQLKALYRLLEENGDDLVEAIRKDLKKPKTEALLAEVETTKNQIKGALYQIHEWVKPEQTETNIILILDKTYILPQPYGVVLVIGAWNYPFLLVSSPLLGAIAAGNCVRLPWARRFERPPTSTSPPVTLELGVKKDRRALLPTTSFCSKRTETRFIEIAKKTLVEFFGDDPELSPDLARIVNNEHFERIVKFLSCGKIAIGGDYDAKEKYIAPTVLIDVKRNGFHHAGKKYFESVLPIITEKPLTLYLFTSNKNLLKKFEVSTSSGSMCVNDTMVHLSVDTLPFGGVGMSGMGTYMGKFSFDTFSHKRSVLVRSLNVFGEYMGKARYPPYTETKTKILKAFLKPLNYLPTDPTPDPCDPGKEPFHWTRRVCVNDNTYMLAPPTQELHRPSSVCKMIYGVCPRQAYYEYVPYNQPIQMYSTSKVSTTYVNTAWIPLPVQNLPPVERNQ